VGFLFLICKIDLITPSWEMVENLNEIRERKDFVSSFTCQARLGQLHPCCELLL
jgi:hypothetical protein